LKIFTGNFIAFIDSVLSGRESKCCWTSRFNPIVWAGVLIKFL